MKTGDLNLSGDPPTVTIQAVYAKNRRKDTLLLPPDAARYLADWLSSRPVRPVEAVRLWPGTCLLRAVAIIRSDLADANVETERFGKVADFRALRATYATNLARVGVNLQTAQALLRHSDPKLTTRTCTKLGVTDLGQAVAGLRLPMFAREAEQGGRGR